MARKNLDKRLRVEYIDALNNDCYRMDFSGDCSEIKKPGQFINIEIPGKFLRRPISIWNYDRNHVTILFKVVGEGTEYLSKLKIGNYVQALLPLGNGFDTSLCTEKTLLVGGGIGMPPMYSLAKALVEEGIYPEVILGFNTEDDLLPIDAFKELGITPHVTTVDGSRGMQGLVTDCMKTLDYDYVCACGPKAMLQAVYELSPDGQFSFEERMGCGIGACMGCTCKTKTGYKRICKDGPVLLHHEIEW